MNVSTMPLWALIPFGLMLLTIAVAPLVVERWWERNINKLLVAMALGVPTAIFLVNRGAIEELEHQIVFDYLPFIVLLATLYVITGGIHLSGDIKAKPAVNTLFLGIGYVLASIMGTTGAAMLLIRPIIKTNSQRKYKTHTILFFIAAVANCGGLLTPLGDPPLFLLYLRGAEFGWFLQMLPEWAFVGIVLLGVYYLLDKWYYRKEDKASVLADNTEVTPLRISGKINLTLLLCTILSVAFINKSYVPNMAQADSPIWVKFLREIVLLSLLALSLYATKKKTRQENHFTWTPIIEVAVVFLGIFTTMTPALLFLNSNAAQFGLVEPSQFFYATGILSSFLDNAPTAVAFHGVASGLVEHGAAVAEVAGVPSALLKAISMGAVFFGALTYIGNGPNFMIKAIAEESKIPMPNFIKYIFTFSLIVMVPIYVLVQLIFI